MRKFNIFIGVVILAAIFLAGVLGYSYLKAAKEDKVILLGLDAAYWPTIDKLIQEGRLPNLARLRKEAACADLTSMYPIFSPRIWTTMATGKLPEEHGILGFTVEEEGEEATPDQRHLYTSNMRQVKALWNIFSEHKISVGIVNWIVGWPPEEVNGFVLTERVKYPHSENNTYPRHIEKRCRQIVMSHIGRLKKAGLDDDSRTDEYATLLGLYFKRKLKPRFFALYLNQLDGSGHEHYETNIEGHYKKYELIDELVGRVLKSMDKNTTLIVVSDHGFADLDPSREGLERALSAHRLQGTLIIYGKYIKRNAKIEHASVKDICKTALYLMGLPVAQDMVGRVITEPIEEEYLNKNPISTIATYETTVRKKETDKTKPISSTMDKEVIERLKALGYLQ